MMRRITGIVFSGLLILGLASACENRPQVTLPKGTYPLPQERATGESKPAAPEGAPKEKTQAPGELPRESTPPGDNK